MAKDRKSLAEPRPATSTDPSAHESRTVGDAHGVDESGTVDENPPANTNQMTKLLTARDKVLTSVESAALKREKDGSLSSFPKGLVIILATCAVGAIVQ